MSEYTPIPDFDCIQKLNRVCVGNIIELFDFCKSQKYDHNRFCEMVSTLSGIPASNINKNALRCKVLKLKKLQANKRGTYLSEFKNENFNCPTCTVSTSSSTKSTLNDENQLVIKSLGNELVDTKKNLEKASQQLVERRAKVRKLQEESKSLKRKLDVRKNFMPVAKKLKVTENRLITVNSKNRKLKQENLELRNEITNLKKQNYLHKKEIKELSSDLKNEREKNTQLDNVLDGYDKNETSAMKTKIKDLSQSVDYLQSIIDDNSELELYDEINKTYNAGLVECVMNLTSFHVSSEQVSNVISEVSRLCGKQPNRLPSRSTVDNIVDRKASVAHKQLSSILKDKENTTLYSDETRKYGHTVETFAVTDADQNSYILGLREMYNKSAQSTLDTLQEILRDIDSHCHLLQCSNKKDSIGFNILCNIKNTMSDRAATEKSFHKLLQEYRSSILPQVKDTWIDLSDDEQKLCSSMNNFYCGLHLLVAIADVTENALIKFESSYNDGKDVGSAAFPELKRFHKAESGTVRLLRTTSKAFSLGGDEKNGVNCAWNTYLKSKNLRNSIVRFKHNRFNLIFLLGQCVYFHNEDIFHFLVKVHGTNNSLLRAISLDVKESLHLAGLKSLGLIAKYVSSPLWRLIENKSHIQDMNVHYESLLNFFYAASKDASSFVSGENVPFEVLVEDDVVLQKLLMSFENIDMICVPMLQSIFLALYELFKRMIPEHLEGGKYHSLTDRQKKETESVKKHNKLPEFIFGQLDHLMNYRPNASTLVNEVFIMYNHNKSREWLMNMDPDEKRKILDESKKEGRQFRADFKKRLKEIEAKRLEAQKQKSLEIEKKEAARIKRSENLTNDVCFYGLWQSDLDVKEGLGRLPTDTLKRQALESQIKFRKNVLKQSHADKKIFTLSSKQPNGRYAKHSIDKLQENVLQLVQASGLTSSFEKKLPDIPLLVGKTVEHKFKDGVTYKGKVICVVPGFPDWYNITYDDDEAIYVYNLIQDYKNGDLRITVLPRQDDDI